MDLGARAERFQEAGTRWKRHGFFALKLLVTVVTIALVLSNISAEEIAALLRRIDLRPLGAALVIFFAGQVISAQRFLCVLKTLGRRITLWESVHVHFVGLWFSQVLPSSLGGDVLKLIMFRRRLGLSRTVRSIVLERIFGLTILMVSVLVFLPLYQVRLGLPALTLGLSVSSVGFFVVLFGAIALAHVRGLRRLMPGQVGWILLLLRDIGRFRRGRPFMEQFWTSLAFHANGIVAYALLGESLGIDLDFMTYVLLVPLVLLVALLPVSFAGWGLREMGAVGLFGLVWIPAEQAFTVSVLFGLLLITTSLPGAAMLLLRSRAQPGGLPIRNGSRP